jgi:disulfide bond formation protein DsbB
MGFAAVRAGAVRNVPLAALAALCGGGRRGCWRSSPLPRPVQMLFVLFAGVLIAVSGAIGVFHAGVEYHWWQGITACTAPVGMATRWTSSIRHCAAR